MQAPFRPPLAFETPRGELGRILAKTKAAAPRFARLPIRERLALFDHIANRYHDVLDDMVRAGSLAKGLDPEKGESGEEWFAHGFCIARFLRTLHQSLNDLALRGEVRFEKGRLSRRTHGGLAMRLYPVNILEALTSVRTRARSRSSWGQATSPPSRPRTRSPRCSSTAASSSSR